jgi:hypothetical protein
MAKAKKGDAETIEMIGVTRTKDGMRVVSCLVDLNEAAIIEAGEPNLPAIVGAELKRRFVELWARVR